jgi:hypothetical protein
MFSESEEIGWFGHAAVHIHKMFVVRAMPLRTPLQLRASGAHSQLNVSTAAEAKAGAHLRPSPRRSRQLPRGG